MQKGKMCKVVCMRMCVLNWGKYEHRAMGRSMQTCVDEDSRGGYPDQTEWNKIGVSKDVRTYKMVCMNAFLS